MLLDGLKLYFLNTASGVVVEHLGTVVVSMILRAHALAETGDGNAALDLVVGFHNALFKGLGIHDEVDFYLVDESFSTVVLMLCFLLRFVHKIYPIYDSISDGTIQSRPSKIR